MNELLQFQCLVGEISGIGSHTHKFRPLMELDTDLRKHFRGHLDNLDSQLDRNYQEGKQFDKTFDEITEDCKRWKEEVAAKTEIQVSEMFHKCNHGATIQYSCQEYHTD